MATVTAVEITVPTNADYYGESTPERAGRIAERLRERLADWAQERWPGARIASRLVPDTVARQNRGCVWSGDMLDDEAANELEQRAGELWAEIDAEEA